MPDLASTEFIGWEWIVSSGGAQAWIGVVGGLLAAILGILKYFSYRSRRDRVSVIGEAFSSTVKDLSSDAQAQRLAAAILLRRFFDGSTEQGAAGRPYERETVAVIAALLRSAAVGDQQKLLADGLGYAHSLRGADLQGCNLSGAYLGQRQRPAVTAGAARMLASRAPWSKRNRPGYERGDHSATAVDLSGADLYQANLSGASLRDAIAVGTVFFGAVLEGTVFDGARLTEANFRGAQLRGARFARADLTGAHFEDAVDMPEEISKRLSNDMIHE